ncbi:hypothetical protein JOL62DRAFT_629892 [Phyllosticta paracitricarpa]|uniref:BRCT domain-containing protein n=2 Tax=Phyllosticta TaxID=121621 RepID=A0ABR1MVV8_9PEZI
MKNPLKRLIITASGTFSKDRGPGNMKRWVENAGGRWSTVVNDEVTHLIATEDDWKNQSPTVKDAKTRAKIHIVTYDWLEDSLRAQHPYAPKKYLWTTVEKVKQAAKSTTGKKREKKEEMKDLKRGAAAAKRNLQSEHISDNKSPSRKSKCRTRSPSRTRSSSSSSSPSPTPAQPHDSSVQKLEAFRAATAARRAEALTQKIRSNLSSCASPTDNYHVYVDLTGFAHNITLTRVNILTNSSEMIELSLYESNFETTKFYAVHIAYFGFNGVEEKKILINPGASFDEAFQMFRAAFKRVCLIPWEQRFLGDFVKRKCFQRMEMHKRGQKEMERFGEIFTFEKSDGTFADPQKPWLNDDEDDDDEEEAEAGADGKRKRAGDGATKRKRRKKGAEDSDDEEREKGPKMLSAEDLEACAVNPFKYYPPPKGKPRGLMPAFNVEIGNDDMKADQEFLTIPNL